MQLIAKDVHAAVFSDKPTEFLRAVGRLRRDEWIDTEQDPDEPYEPLRGIAERLRKMGEES